MTPEVTTGFIGEVANFLKDNWDEVLLLGFTVIQCLTCIIMLFRRDLPYFLMFAPVYYPALVLLVASLFYNTSWMLLTGYVVGSSLTMSVALWSYGGDEKNVGKAMANGFFTVMICAHLIFG